MDTYNLRYHQIFLDTFFCGYVCAILALKKQTYICGTLRKNAANIPFKRLQLKGEQKLQNHEFVQLVNSENCATCIGVQDGSKFFTMLSTLPINPFQSVDRPLKKPRTNNNYGSITKNICIINDEYIDNMHGVDRSNQYCEDFGCNTKTAKWIHHSYFGFLDATIAQTLVLYNNTTATVEKRNKSLKTGVITKGKLINYLMKTGIHAMAKLAIDLYNKYKSKYKSNYKSKWEQKKKERYSLSQIKCVRLLKKEAKKLRKEAKLRKKLKTKRKKKKSRR